MTSALPGLGPPHSLRLRPDDLLWGIDSDTRRVSVAVLQPFVPMMPGTPGEGAAVLQWQTRSLPGSAASPVHVRQANAVERLVPFFHELASYWGVPSLVTVEEPFSQNSQSNVSSWSLGALLVALGLEFPAVEVRMMNPGEWKKPATGHGYGPGIRAQFKESRARYRAEKARLMEWARGAGYTGELQDEADAVGVVVGSAVMLEARRS